MRNFRCFPAILLIATMFLSFNACSDDGEDDKKESLIVGKWKLISGNGNVHTHLEFKSNGTFEYTSTEELDYEEHGKWKIESDILYMLFSDEEEDWMTNKIHLLNSMSLIIEEFNDDGSLDGESKDSYQRIK